MLLATDEKDSMMMASDRHNPTAVHLARFSATATAALLVVGIVVEGDWSLFVLHPLGMTLALWLGTEAVAGLQATPAHQKKDEWRRHWILQEVAGICMVVAAIVMYSLKADEGEVHFVSLHARLGLATLVLAIVQRILAYIYCFFPFIVGGRTRAVVLLKWHRFVGVIAHVALYATFFLALLTHWFLGSSINGLLFYLVSGTSLVAFVSILLQADLKIPQ